MLHKMNPISTHKKGKDLENQILPFFVITETDVSDRVRSDQGYSTLNLTSFRAFPSGPLTSTFHSPFEALKFLLA